MNRLDRRIAAAAIAVLALAAFPAVRAGKDSGWRETFDVDRSRLAATGRNPYFVLEPGRKLEYARGRAKLVMTVLDETVTIDGVATRVVEERESSGGMPTETSRNYLAIDPLNGDLYYFGEDVDNFRHGKPAGHEGSWRSGIDGARFGMFLPGKPKVGDRFAQEIAPKIAQDRLEITAVDATVKTPAGEFKNCLAVSETSPLESGTTRKFFAPGVGLILDDGYSLARIVK